MLKSKRRRHYRVTFEDALEGHTRALKEAGGLPGILNEGLIRSAVERPYNGHYRRIYQKAAALLESTARNHGFADGNKRTALYLLDLLLSRSGYRLAFDSNEALNAAIEELILSTARGRMQYGELVDWFRTRIAPR